MKYLFIFLFVIQCCVQAEESYYSSLYKKMKYEASLKYTQMADPDWWTNLDPYNIYLGALPLKNKGHLEAIRELGVTHVIPVVEDFELDEGYFNTPVTKADWEEAGIGVIQVEAVDFSPLTKEQIKSGVDALAKLIKEGHIVYIHCKAGHGRSPTIVICYLMEHEMLSFDDAFAFISEKRPQISLNEGQRKAIFDYFEMKCEEAPSKSWVPESISNYFQTTELISQESLATHLESMLYYVIEGVTYSPGEKAPASLAGWIPDINVESTLSRRNRYLREYEGNQEAATEAAISRNHSMFRRLKIAASSAVPIVGVPTSYSITLWHQMREIALIAAINGHDVHDPEVQVQMLTALAGGNLMKIPSATVDLLARQIVKKILIQVGISSVSSTVAVPAHVLFNFFSDNAAKVSTHAKALFAGQQAIAIPPEEYFEKLN